MSLVVALMLAWLSIFLFALLPRKLPLRVNILLYMAVLILVINQFMIVTFALRLYDYRQEVPQFFAVVLHRDITYSFCMLIFANAMLTALSPLRRLGHGAAVFALLFVALQSLRWTGAVEYLRWNAGYDALMIACTMAAAYGLAKGLLAVRRKEEASNG